MKISLEMKVCRIPDLGGSSAVRSEAPTPTVKPTPEEVVGLINLLLHIERALGAVAAWIEVGQIRFCQGEREVEWVASPLRIILKDPGSGKKLETKLWVRQNWLADERRMLEAVRFAVERVKGALLVRKAELFRSVRDLDLALTTIKVPKL